MQATAARAAAYEQQGHDAVRASFELPWLAQLLQRLLREAPGGEVLDLGCGDGAVARLAGLERYVGVDLAPPESGVDAEFVAHDLVDGLGPVGPLPFDLYLGGFGIASHLAPGELGRLLQDIAWHARPGALVAIEALGLHSLEWPQLGAAGTVRGGRSSTGWRPTCMCTHGRPASCSRCSAGSASSRWARSTGRSRQLPSLPRAATGRASRTCAARSTR